MNNKKATSNNLLIALFVSILLSVPFNSMAQTTFKAMLSSSNEVSPVQTMAHGEITATLDGNELAVEGSFDDLSSNMIEIAGTPAHIHAGKAGENGGVAVALTVSADGDNQGGSLSTGDNTFTLDDSQVETLNDRGMYVNIHTENYSAGELRGQLLLDADAHFRANLSGAFEVPAVESEAFGSVVLELHGDSLFASGTFHNLSSDVATDIGGGAHIHAAPAGANGDVAVALDITLNDDNQSGMLSVDSNRFELSAAQKTALMNREMYVNIHSTNYNPGEIRGQVVNKSSVGFYADFSGSAEVGEEVNTGAYGAAIAELNGDSVFVSGHFDDLSGTLNNIAGTPAHIHAGMAGSNGGVAKKLAVAADDDSLGGMFHHSQNRVELNADEKAVMLDRGFYLNIHSANYPAGELRGQILGEATTYFTATLSGTNEVQPVATSGYGAAIGEVKDSTLIVSGSFNGLVSPLNTEVGSHLHQAGPGSNGGVQVPLTFTLGDMDTTGTYAASSNTFTLSQELKTGLFDEEMYVNVHTDEYGAGEVRGQMVHAPNAYADSSAITAPADGAELTLEGAASTDFTATWEGSMDPDENEVVYIWQLSTDQEFGNILVNANVGSQTNFTTDFATVDDILENAGVESGGTATVYHRVVVSDGSERTAGKPKSVSLTRGSLTDIEEENGNVPDRIKLSQNYPNPFNPTTTIRFTLDKAANASIKVYNIAGQNVATITDKNYSAGNHKVTFNAGNLSSGIYFYELNAGDTKLMRKMTLMK